MSERERDRETLDIFYLPQRLTREFVTRLALLLSMFTFFFGAVGLRPALLTTSSCRCDAAYVYYYYYGIFSVCIRYAVCGPEGLGSAAFSSAQFL